MTERPTPTKERCPECQGSGLRRDDVTITSICPCPAGKARENAHNSTWE